MDHNSGELIMIERINRINAQHIRQVLVMKTCRVDVTVVSQRQQYRSTRVSWHGNVCKPRL